MKENEYFKKFNKEYNKRLNVTLNGMENDMMNDHYFVKEIGINPKWNKHKGAEAEYGNFNAKIKNFVKKNNYYR